MLRRRPITKSDDVYGEAIPADVHPLIEWNVVEQYVQEYIDDQRDISKR